MSPPSNTRAAITSIICPRFIAPPQDVGHANGNSGPHTMIRYFLVV
jgi:hypothetical protein